MAILKITPEKFAEMANERIHDAFKAGLKKKLHKTVNTTFNKDKEREVD